MKRLLILVSVIGFILASSLTPLRAQWNVAYVDPGLGGSAGLHFPDTTHGWFVGSFSEWNSRIMRTTDGARNNFEPQVTPSGTYNLNSILMEDTMIGWAVGGTYNSGKGTILHTTDGGTNWILVSHTGPSPSGFQDVTVVNGTAWFIGSYKSGSVWHGLIMHTSDNGQTWIVNQYPSFGELYRITVFDEMNFVIGGYGVLARTTDGGGSWISAGLSQDYVVERVEFADLNIGYALVTDWTNMWDTKEYLYVTTDGGYTWNLRYSWLDNARKGGLSTIGVNTIFVAGWINIPSSNGGIFKSTDSGFTWDTVLQNAIKPPTGIFTPDDQHGWTVSSSAGGAIYRYDYVTPPTIEPISNKLIQFGQAFTYQVEATGMGLEYSMSGHPTGLNIGAYSGLINGVPIEGGEFDITVAVQDTDANVVTEDFRLKVNRKPLFIPPFPSTHAWVDSLYQFQLSVEDVDDDTVSFYWLSKPNWLVFLTASITSVVISGVPTVNDTGYHNVSVMADDGYGGQDTLSWTLQVELYLPPVNHAPQFVGSWPDTVTVYRDSSYTWNFEFQDMDGDSLFAIAGELGVPGMQVLAGWGIGSITVIATGQPTDTGWSLANVNVRDEQGALGGLQFWVYVDFVTGVEPIPGVPTDYALEQNYPNPFNPSTTIEYSIPRASEVRLTVYSLLGEEVEVLVNQYQPVGFYQVDFNGSSLPSGIYFYRLEAGSYTSTKKMVLTK